MLYPWRFILIESVFLFLGTRIVLKFTSWTFCIPRMIMRSCPFQWSPSTWCLSKDAGDSHIPTTPKSGFYSSMADFQPLTTMAKPFCSKSIQFQSAQYPFSSQTSRWEVKSLFLHREWNSDVIKESLFLGVFFLRPKFDILLPKCWLLASYVTIP